MPDNINDRLARIETKLDAFLITTDDQEKRIRKLEYRQASIFGGFSLVAAALAVYVSVATAGAI